ncbi:MAG TPA: glycosyltransferase [bacterium]|nr:glycosyltransferase [bacterium]
MPEFRPGVVSIMIPTYNQAAYIGDTIRSVLAQTYTQLEIIVADDASTDETPEIVAGFADPRIKYFRNERNIGRVRNYHKALYEHATGAWAANLDGDDYYIYPRFIEDSLSALSEHAGSILAFSEYARLDDGAEADKVITDPGPGHIKVLDGNEFFFSMPRNPMRLRHMTTVYDRREALRIGFYVKDIISADYESLFRLMLNNKLIHLDRIIGVWRRHGDNLSTNLNVASWIDNLELFSSVGDYAKRVLTGGEKNRVDGWFRRNSVNYARRMMMRALGTADPHLVAAVLKRVWKRDRAILLLTLFSPVTMLVMFRKALTRIVHRFAGGNRA